MENFLYALSNVNLKNIICGVCLGSTIIGAISIWTMSL